MTLSQLPALSGLFLQYNKLWGTIPSNLSSLTNLTDLYLNNNTLSGAIPPEIGQLSNLQGTPITTPYLPNRYSNLH
jgi:Leucine-rich repeat (LRR) protein